MNTPERFQVLKTELANLYNTFIAELAETSDVKDLDNRIVKLKNAVTIIRQSYSVDIQKIFQMQKIENLNSKDFLTAEELRGLLIGGSDELTNLGTKQLFECMQNALGPMNSSNIMEHITEAFGGDLKLKGRAMRWVLRGLSVDHAITKIQYDLKTFGN